MKKKIVFSGIQPSGFITIGHYISILSKWESFQNYNKCFFCIADLHSITNNNIMKININNNILHILSILISLNIDPNKNIIFLQSKISEHLKLFWVFSSFIKFNKIKKMHQFKKNINKNPNIGVITYPILMSADILLYKSNLIPIGYDQIQHIELTKIISINFNKIYGNIFNVPEYYINDNSCIMSLINCNNKMSKSDKNKNNYILLTDNNSIIKNKINKSITDSNFPPLIIYDKINKPGISNLLNIVSKLENISIKSLEDEFKNKNYNEFKKYVSDIIIKNLTPIKNKYSKIRNNESYLKKIILNGNKQAKKIAKKNFKHISDLFYNNFNNLN